MRIAFYAPMKPPGASVPSGDRAVARLLIRALEAADHTVELASSFCSRDARGDQDRQRRLRRIGERLADRLIRRYRSAPVDRRPVAWFTYHLYYKAPDWLGPAVSEAMDIPYVVAEASHAPKRADGAWAVGHDGAERAIRRADAIVGLNSADGPCVLPLLAAPEVLTQLAPFIDTEPFDAASGRREQSNARLCDTLGLDRDAPILLTVAMMRHGDKLASYRVLAEALAALSDEPWTLIVCGDGLARDGVESAFSAFPSERVRFLGAYEPEALPDLYAAADIYVWPAVREAFGIAILEAQAAGLPVVAGDAGGVGDIVADGETGLLAAEGDAKDFAAALRVLLQAPYFTAAYSAAARRKAAVLHGLGSASARLDQVLSQAVGAVRR